MKVCEYLILVLVDILYLSRFKVLTMFLLGRIIEDFSRFLQFDILWCHWEY